MNWLQSLIYGLISGLSEIVPVSAAAHQKLLCKLFGQDQPDPLLNFLIHISVLIAIYVNCRNHMNQLLRSISTSKRRRGAQAADYEIRFIKTGSAALIVGLFAFTYIFNLTNNLATVAVFCLLNGLILFVSGRSLQGNKTARHLSSLDAAATGILGALSVFPGLSRIGISVSYPILRGSDRQAAFNWALIMSIPAVTALTLMDLISMFAGMEVMSFGVYLGYVLSMASAYIGTTLAILFMRFVVVRDGVSGFAYYSWGAALFAFILYLI